LTNTPLPKAYLSYLPRLTIRSILEGRLIYAPTPQQATLSN